MGPGCRNNTASRPTCPAESLPGRPTESAGPLSAPAPRSPVPSPTSRLPLSRGRRRPRGCLAASESPDLSCAHLFHDRFGEVACCARSSHVTKERLLLRAALLGPRTSRPEAASARWLQGGRNFAGQDDPPSLPPRVRHRDGGEQGARVRMGTTLEHLQGLSEFHDFSKVHDRDVIREVAHEGQVVRDEEVREPEVALEILEEVHDLRLHRDVKGGCRLVEDEEARLDREGAGDRDALALPPAQLVRIPLCDFRMETNAGEEFVDVRLRLHLRHLEMDPQRLRDGGAGPHPRIQGAHRVLEDRLEPQAGGAKRLATKRGQVLVIEPDAPSPRAGGPRQAVILIIAIESVMVAWEIAVIDTDHAIVVAGGL